MLVLCASEGFRGFFIIMNENDPNIIDLRDMPLFFEEVTEESFIPVQGPKRLDGLSSPKIQGDSSSLSNKPWLPLIVLIPLAGLAWSMVYTSAHRSHMVARTQPTTKVAAVTPPPVAPQATVTTEQVMYVAPGIGLKIYASADYNAPVLENAQVNTPLTIISSVDTTWVYVQDGDLRGYTAKALLWPTPVN